MKVKSESEVAQSCPTLSDPMDCSPPGSSVHWIFQARVLEWVATAFSVGGLYLLNISLPFHLNCCVWGGLSAGWKFVVPLYCGACSLWVELDKWLVKVSWLGKLMVVFWWVELDLLSLECNEVSSSEF